MAAAPQGDPNQRKREPIVESQRRVEKEVGTGRPFAWVWIWIPLIIAAFWFAGWGWGPWGGWWWGHGRTSATSAANNSKAIRAPNQPAPNKGAANTANTAQTPPPGAPGTAGAPYRAAGATPTANVTGSGVAVLDAQNKSPFVGHPFQIRNIPVEKVASKDALWVGTSNTRTAGPLLAVLGGGAMKGLNGSLTAGERVDLSGTVEKAPPTRQAEHNWKISSEDAHNVQADGVYVRASRITRAQP